MNTTKGQHRWMIEFLSIDGVSMIARRWAVTAAEALAQLRQTWLVPDERVKAVYHMRRGRKVHP